MSSLSREQVLHVARLARLDLDDAEVEKLAGELDKVVDWIDKIAELDLEGVEPTSHVVDVENVLREDVPSDCLDPEIALASAPDPAPGGFRVPSPGGGSNPTS